MKKILLISVAALFAWAASAQDNTYRNTQTNNYRNAAQTNNYRNAAQTYNNNAAQAGNYRGTPSDYRSAVGPRVNFYTNTDDASVVSAPTTATASIRTGASSRRSMY